MAPFNQSPQPRRPVPADDAISCRVTNPISSDEDVGRVFLDERQAKATTATRLFRNRELFGVLRRHAMPAFFGRTAHGGRECSIWSAGCSSGEEVYSLAMVALDEFAKKRLAPRLACFGTDINQQRIAEARAGLYGRPAPTAFDNEYWVLLRRHAEGAGQGAVQMGAALREVCRFGLFDIRKKPKNHVFDFIVCNHVLQYYDLPGQLNILANLVAVLKPGGLLYLEGITRDAIDGSRLAKLDGPNLFAPAGR